jgi:hypothetical protein
MVVGFVTSLVPVTLAPAGSLPDASRGTLIPWPYSIGVAGNGFERRAGIMDNGRLLSWRCQHRNWWQIGSEWLRS